MVFNILDALVSTFCVKVKRVGFNSSKARNKFFCKNQHSEELKIET